MQFLPLFRHPLDFAYVSDEDFEYLRQFRWTLCNGYVRRWIGGGYLWLHHEVAERMGLTYPPGHEIDHADGLPVNNCRENLRVVDRTQNNFYRHYYMSKFEPYVTPIN